jgi:hypothetical protein
MIVFAVVALMTLTAGVAAAASAGNSAKFEARGVVLDVGLFHGASVTSIFNLKKNGKIKSIDIHTVREYVAGAVTEVKKCKGGEIEHSTRLWRSHLIAHRCCRIQYAYFRRETESNKATTHIFGIFPVEVVTGKLKGNLVAEFSLAGALLGEANLKISGKKPSSYACVIGGTPYSTRVRGDCHMPSLSVGSLNTCRTSRKGHR